MDTDRNALFLILRTPKAASTSLSVIAAQAFPQARRFVLPNTLDLEGQVSAFQRLRHARHVAQINHRSHGLLRLARVFELINRTAVPGDVLTGGHVDFETCRKNITRQVKLVALVRNPIDRSLSEYVYARAGFLRKSALAKFDASLIAKMAARHSFEGYLDFLIEHRATFGDIACRYLSLTPGADIAPHFAEHVFHFGTVDNLPGFALGLARKTGNAIKVEHLNQSAGTISRILTRAEHSKIEALYARDFALYDWCRKHELVAPARPAPVPTLVEQPRAALASSM